MFFFSLVVILHLIEISPATSRFFFPIETSCFVVLQKWNVIDNLSLPLPPPPQGYVNKMLFGYVKIFTNWVYSAISAKKKKIEAFLSFFNIEFPTPVNLRQRWRYTYYLPICSISRMKNERYKNWCCRLESMNESFSNNSKS